MTLSPPETRASLILRLPDADDGAAWEEFTAIYGPLVFRLARQRGLQASDADDLVQEVFASVAASVSDWLNRTHRGRFRAWLLRIARNAAVNHLTRRGTRTLAAGGSATDRVIGAIAGRQPFDADEFDLEYRRAVFRWAADQVRAGVATVTWEAFRRTHVDGRPIADVAEELQVSVGTIYIARSRVMSRLRHLVRRFEDRS